MGVRGRLILVAAFMVLAARVALPETGPVIVDGGIPQPLTDQPGDPARGAALVRDMARASWMICHQVPFADEPDQGDIGPPLAGVGGRIAVAELRLRLVDARKVNPDTVMPPYHALDGLTLVGAAFQGKPICSAQEVEDVLARLLTLQTE